MIDLKIQVLQEGTLPTKGTSHAACFDAYAREAHIKYTDGSVSVCNSSSTFSVNDTINATLYHSSKFVASIVYYLGFKTEIPEGYEGELVARSSVRDKCLMLANGKGVIDSDYRGEWAATFHIVSSLVGYYPVYNIGERVAQFKIIKSEQVQLVLTEELTSSERGEGGHGSTGK